MKCLIISADDFGLAKGINEGIAKAHRDGLVTSVNIMPGGEAFEEAVALARSMGLRETGAHLALTEGLPATDPEDIPSLLGANGRFYPSYGRFFFEFFTRKIERRHIYIELKNQINKLAGTGLKINFLSSHQHIHMMPGILKVFLSLAKEYGIPAIRCTYKDRMIPPFTLEKFYKAITLSSLRGRMEAAIGASGLRCTDGYFGFLDAGGIDERSIINILGSLGDGVTELNCHPGFLSQGLLELSDFHRRCEVELSAVTSPAVKKFINDKEIKLISYGEWLDGR